MGRKRKPKNGPPWWPCDKTGKRGYASKLDCLTVLARTSKAKAMCRAFYCRHCGRWHLTSQEKRGARA